VGVLHRAANRGGPSEGNEPLTSGRRAGATPLSAVGEDVHDGVGLPALLTPWARRSGRDHARAGELLEKAQGGGPCDSEVLLTTSSRSGGSAASDASAS
jgi:hypothetical protein